MGDDPVDGRRLRYAHRRGELLRAATEHVLEHGLDDLTLRGLADGVGVSHATLVHHFATRDGLIAEIVERVLAETFSSPTSSPAPRTRCARCGRGPPHPRAGGTCGSSSRSPAAACTATRPSPTPWRAPSATARPSSPGPSRPPDARRRRRRPRPP
ncbi:TetR/AcrR family transcriptional regulator [Clavibacter tessellarius]|uniref:TetR/AcrR family transcriptional regulator n=1 Tax=Clavibacter tessellarius TaxID=31965 RepID=UPI0039BF1491